jgi:MFS family permease
VTPTPLDRSYRALFRVPSLGRIIVSMQLARIAAAMVNVAIVLFTLATFDSPALAGLVTFAAVFPGLLVSPVAGALLDRHGRVRLIALDYVVAASSMLLIAALALAGALPAALLVLIAAVASLTSILSHTGLRSLFPLVVPQHLWERVNAVDSNGYVVATIIGPPLAAAMVSVLGAPEALIAIAALDLLAVVALVGVREPVFRTETSGRLLRDAWLGVRYVWANPTLRGLGFSLSAVNIAQGMTTVVIPVLIIQTLGAGEVVVGLVFALSGVAGMISVSLAGRYDSRGHEWPMIVIPMALTAPIVALLLPVTGFAGAEVGLESGLALMAGFAIGVGILNGPLDIAIFTVRQRRTEPSWLGRAFAVSMAVNFAGFPIGAALGGAIAAVSTTAAVMMGVVACVAGAACAASMIPRTSDEPGLRLAPSVEEPAASRDGASGR